jgi:hypothetical protein
MTAATLACMTNRSHSCLLFVAALAVMDVKQTSNNSTHVRIIGDFIR